VPFNPKLQQRIDEATYHPGECMPAHLARIDASHAHATVSYPGDRELAALIDSYRHDGMSDEQISDRLNNDRIPTKEYFSDVSEQPPQWTPRLVAARRALPARTSTGAP
jgi:hypothetical protein